MYETRVVSVVRCWSHSIHTGTSIRLGGTVPERTCNSDNMCPFSQGMSRGLEQLLSTVRIVEKTIRSNALLVRISKVLKRAIHPCCSNCHCDHRGHQKYLCCRTPAA